MFIRVQFVKFLKNIETYKYLKHFIIYAIIITLPQNVTQLRFLTPQDGLPPGISEKTFVRVLVFNLILLTKVKVFRLTCSYVV